MSPIARSDDSHDARYTHPTNLEEPKPSGGNYPRMMYGKPYVKGHETVTDTVVVNTPEEFTANIKDGAWKDSPDDWKKPASKQAGFSRVSALVALAVLSVSVLFGARAVTAQTLPNHPTLGAAVTANQTSIPVSSLTSINVGDCFFVDNEEMYVQVVPTTGTLINVVRGYNGTKAFAHANAAQAINGPCNAYFHVLPPPSPYSACTRSAQLYIPWVDTVTGSIWVCEPGGTWNVTNSRPSTTGNSFQYSLLLDDWLKTALARIESAVRTRG